MSGGWRWLADFKMDTGGVFFSALQETSAFQRLPFQSQSPVSNTKIKQLSNSNSERI